MADPWALIDALRNTQEGVGEVAATIGSGMIAQPIAGLHGIATALRNLPKGKDEALRRARESIDETQQALTYQPRGDAGRRGLENISRAIEPVATALKENIADPVGALSPLAGAALIALPNVLPGPGKARVKLPGAALEHAIPSGGMNLEVPATSQMAEILRSGQAPAIPARSEGGAILPRTGETRIPVAQEAIPRLTPTGKVPEMNERSAALLRSKRAADAVDTVIAKGRAINPDLEHWYGTEPLRQFALNEGLSPAEFDRMLAQLSSASQRNPVPKENLLGSYMWGLDKRGKLTPESRLFTKNLEKTQGMRPDDPGVIALPEGMGGLAQTSIFNRGRQLAMGAKPEDIFGDKLFSYLSNKRGNEMPVTIDVNAMKGPVMTARQGAWLKTLHQPQDAQGNIIGRYTPLADWESGKLKMKDALQNVSHWSDAPASIGEYKAFEDLWRRGANRAGVSPAGAQALGWYGSGDVTALKTQPRTYVELLEDSARKAAERQGVTPTEAMRRFVKGVPGGQLGGIEGKLAATLGVGAGGAAVAGPYISAALRDIRDAREKAAERKRKILEPDETQ